MSCSLALVLIAMVKRMCGVRSWETEHQSVSQTISRLADQSMHELNQRLTLYTGWTAGSCLYMAIANTSVIRCVLSRWVMVWWWWKSAERTQILASSQSY